MATLMQQTRGISSVLSSKNPIFADGQMIWEQDTGRIKFGNGVDHYNNLPYVKCGNHGESSGGGSTVELLPVGTALNDATWEQISAVAQAGKGADYWNIGDCKEITLNGKIGDYLTADNLTLCVFILNFNHPENGVADNNIVFGCFKTSVTNGVDVALLDSQYNKWPSTGEKAFNISHWGASNHGGWKGCDLRYDILGATHIPPSGYGAKAQAGRIGYDATAETLTNPKADTFLAALPADLRSVLRLWKRYVDAVGGTNSDTDNAIQETIDAVSLLTEYEVIGTNAYANSYESDHNTQMTYYKDGNSLLKVKHTSLNSNSSWFLSSAAKTTADNSCRITNTTYQKQYNDTASALAPAFKL